MKIFISILVLIIFTLYLCLFSVSIESFRDTGSCRRKVTRSIVGFETNEIIENTVSKYLTAHDIKYAEKWLKRSSYRGGLIKERIFKFEDLWGSTDIYIKLLSRWLEKNLKDGKAKNLEKEALIQATVIKFIECLSKEDFKGMEQLIDFITNDFVNNVQNSIEETNPK